METKVQFDHSYFQLGASFYQQISPTSVPEPSLLLWNSALAQQLAITEAIANRAAEYFSGNVMIPGAKPLALAYAGHQFGGFNPQLGDGRAHLLGELIDKRGGRYDLQLKGSGQTQFSRRGDGRCALKPAVREYIMSETMAALGIPTSRTLAVVTSGEELYRGLAEPGAVICRVASSHIRVGTFQYFAAQGDTQSLAALLDYAIRRHFPHIDIKDEQRAYLFLDAVINKQLDTLVHWMRVGFIHGVMNTDNMTISGETIDYGPCAMMGIYHPQTVYSSIDRDGRYCFGNQPAMMQWNMARLAESLIAVIPGEKTDIIKQLEAQIHKMTKQYQTRFYNMMTKQKCDYTLTFLQLAEALETNSTAPRGIDERWYQQWLQKVKQGEIDASLTLMSKMNPRVIPRNHHVEKVLEQCQSEQNSVAVSAFLEVLLAPYQQTEKAQKYQDVPIDGDRYYQTFCGT